MSTNNEGKRRAGLYHVSKSEEFDESGLRCVAIRDVNNWSVAHLFGDSGEDYATANFIVAACNAHEELVRFAEMVKAVSESTPKGLGRYEVAVLRDEATRVLAKLPKGGV